MIDSDQFFLFANGEWYPVEVEQIEVVEEWLVEWRNDDWVWTGQTSSENIFQHVLQNEKKGSQ